METNVSAQDTLKYNIARRLDQQPRQFALSIRRRIIAKHGSATAWNDWLKLKKTDSRDIPAGVLRSLAELLAVPMEALFNDKPEV